MPTWLLPDEDADVFSIDGPFAAEQIELCDNFFSEIAHHQDGKEWRDAYKLGREFRKLVDRLNCPAIEWSRQSSARWVQDRFDWACKHPGVSLPNSNEYFEIW